MATLSFLLAASFALCSGSPRVTCVVDGDTFWLEGQKIRIADINAPETHRPGCASERTRGKAATRRLMTLLNAGSFEMRSVRRDKDRYGRLLRVVTRGGESVGDTLVAEGLAEYWSGRRGDWCGSG